MKSNSATYINVVKLPNQLKVDYKVIRNGNIIKSDQASFLTYGDAMTQEILFKLESLQKEDKYNYVSTILNSSEQFICPNNQISKYNESQYDFIELYDKTTIVTPKNVVFETKHFFEKSGIDYIFSPFQVLTHHILDTPVKNNMVALIIANIVYIMITDSTSTIIYNSIKKLTPFEEIKNSNFYDDDIKGQKLFDEIYFYELQDIIKEVLEEFYNTKENSFVEKISILYTLKQLDNNEIKVLEDTFGVNVSYHMVSLDNYMYELANSKRAKKSFILPRNKRNIKSEYLLWIGSAAAASLATVYLVYSMYTPKINQQKEQSSQMQVEKQELLRVLLPDHISRNLYVNSEIKKIFDSIPYNVVLNEVVLDSKDSIIVCDFLEKDTFVKQIKPIMLDMYENSTIVFNNEDENISPILIGVIKNTNLKINNDLKFSSYNNTTFSYTLMQDSLKNILDPNSQIIYYKSDIKDDIQQNLFEIILKVSSPQEFYNFVDKLNALDYSVSIEYPIRFVKDSQDNSIDVKFHLSFNQSNI